MSSIQSFQLSARSKATRANVFSLRSQSFRNAGFQTCCIADFQIGGSPEFVRVVGWQIRDTADLEVCATVLFFRIHQK
jgi:hypothetical protein